MFSSDVVCFFLLVSVGLDNVAGCELKELDCDIGAHSRARALACPCINISLAAEYVVLFKLDELNWLYSRLYSTQQQNHSHFEYIYIVMVLCTNFHQL